MRNLTFSEPSGSNQSVVLKDGTILTVASRHDFIARSRASIKVVPSSTQSQFIVALLVFRHSLIFG